MNGSRERATLPDRKRGERKSIKLRRSMPTYRYYVLSIKLRRMAK